jgi:hypothetical protein
VINRLIILFT